LSERLRQFWQTRYAKHGHTGWSDSAIYAYDQLERLAIVGSAIERLGNGPETALDYGCGSGDFSPLLLRSGLRVWGCEQRSFAVVSRWIRIPNVAYMFSTR
jgi:hypothetical protein